ncbi:MAG: RCC1 domain-containing protein [Verrucomicrobiia bacterium]
MKKSRWLPRLAVLAPRRIHARLTHSIPASRRSVRCGLLLLLFCLTFGGWPGFAQELIVWGSGNHGLADVPEVEGGIAQIAAGGRHILALSSNGVIVAWGDNNAGQTDVPPEYPCFERRRLGRGVGIQ